MYISYLRKVITLRPYMHNEKVLFCGLHEIQYKHTNCIDVFLILIVVIRIYSSDIIASVYNTCALIFI